MKEVTCNYHRAYISTIFRFLSEEDQQLFTNHNSLTPETFDQTFIDTETISAEFTILDFQLTNS